jgi:hypothetical protein
MFDLILTMTTEKDTNVLIVCPLCDEKFSQCRCNVDWEDENSVSIRTEADTIICGFCGNLISNCMCDFPQHNINKETGVCVKCLQHSPGNQLCISRSAGQSDVVTSTPKSEKEKSASRRKLFADDVPYHYVSTSVPTDSFTKPDYEVHPIKCKQSVFLGPGESVNLSTNVIITEAVGTVTGFLFIMGNPPQYWLESMTASCFCIKTGVLRGDYAGSLSVSIINKMSESIVVKSGTNLGLLKYQKFI